MHRRLFTAWLVAVSTSFFNVQALTVSEVSGSGYDLCLQSELTPFTTEILTEYTDCAARTTFNWDSGFLPTPAQRQEMCGCKLLISKFKTVRVPHCGFYRVSLADATTGFYSYKNLVEFAFGLCSTSSTSSTSSSTTTTTTTTTTTKPTATTAPTPWYYNTVPTYTPITYAPTYTYSPSFDLDTSTSSSSKKSKSKAGVIVGIVVAAAVVAAIAAFVVRKKKKKAHSSNTSPVAGEEKRRQRHSSSDSDVDAGVVHIAVDVAAHGELSPLGVEATYAEMPSSPGRID